MIVTAVIGTLPDLAFRTWKVKVSAEFVLKERIVGEQADFHAPVVVGLLPIERMGDGSKACPGDGNRQGVDAIGHRIEGIDPPIEEGAVPRGGEKQRRLAEKEVEEERLKIRTERQIGARSAACERGEIGKSHANRIHPEIPIRWGIGPEGNILEY